jgi:ATP adenylyltransferase/5',5'''-P-1,P-4-tetraphosphate phosphorylase II
MVKLQSGREIEFKPLNIMQRAEILDDAHIFAVEHPKAQFSFKTFVKALTFAGIKDADLLEWSQEEIAEAAMQIFSTLTNSESFKKK